MYLRQRLRKCPIFQMVVVLLHQGLITFLQSGLNLLWLYSIFPELRQIKELTLSDRKVLPSYWNDIAFTLLRDALRHNCCNVSVEWDKRTFHGTALFFHTTAECRCCCCLTPEHKSEVIIFLKPGKCSMMCIIPKRVWDVDWEWGGHAHVWKRRKNWSTIHSN